LRKQPFVDVFSSNMSTILIQVRGLHVMRILPYYDYGIGDGFVSDKTRFIFDSINEMRIEMPTIIFGSYQINVS